MNSLRVSESFGHQLPTNGPRVSPISWWITRSARSSCSVGSLLMITSLAPQFLASMGNPAAGQTTSDEPMARNRSQCWASSVARRIASSGIACPNEMVAVFTGSPQAGQSGAWLAAADAAGISGIAMEFDHMLGRKTRVLVQVVDVLGDDGGNLARFIERRQRAMTAARSGRGKGRLHRKTPPPCFVAGVLAGDEFVERDWPVAGPHSAGRAEIGNAGFGGDAGPGERNNDS